MEFRACDEFDGGLGWIAEERFVRTSHALAADGGVWLVDPVDTPELEATVGALGEVRGVIQLLDRHGRDSAELARRFGVPHARVPFDTVVPGAPFEFVRVVDVRGWREAALWWPERRVLVCADALGTVPFFCAGDEPVGVHPLLRLVPPRALARFHPEHLLCGHGEGLHGPEATSALHVALATSRGRSPRLALRAAGGMLGGARRLVRRS